MLRVLFFSSLLLTVFFLFSDQSISHEPGILAPDGPAQSPVQDDRMFLHDEYMIHPLATFEVKARVLSRERYYLDRESDLAPFDLALGWGYMSDERVLSHLSISQSNRWYWWRARQLPIAKEEISANSANMHMVPADDYIKRQIKRARTGSIVKFKGYLIEAKGEDGWRWRSSLSRFDTGNHACELVFVEEFEILD